MGKSVLLRSIAACAVLTMAAGLFAARSVLSQGAAPHYVADVSWPKPLPDLWVLGGLGGVCVDAQDHVVVLNRQDVYEGDLNAGKLAPPIIEFDPAGNVVHSWGDAKLAAQRLHGCHFDADGNLWLAGADTGMVRKYSHDGTKLLLQIGQDGVFDSDDGTIKGRPLNSNAARFFMPSSLFVDRQNGDVYVADGEGINGNRRIAVVDRIGTFLRQWQPEGTDTVHCLSMSNDGLIYVCNREHGRVQVYDRMGSFKANIEVPWIPVTRPADGKITESGGSAASLAFSPDPERRLMFVINQNNGRIDILERKTGKRLSSFGRLGNFPGEFNQPHGIAVDSKGDVYVAENRGKRIHKFKSR